ncbi:voltage-dependent anion-selective channel-like [Teleopsis dalmanni]|uniref:voltage-dependent anion-selective channel-like n=1 Tax=Teleopsis dalmanni TaxID=139649 RepID=UPI0018CEED07|nr:voltage-dependent anion-selective channel-like [Teleopsis dalmanni]
MAPPSYVDIGSWARNVLTKGYHFGLWKIMCNAKTTAGLDLNSTGYSKEDDGKVFGQLDSKYVIPDYGLTLIEKWNTDNKLFAEVSCSDKIAEGVKVGIKGSYELNTREKEGKIFGAYSHENVKFDISCDIDTNGPNVDASLVLGYNSFLGGLSTQLNTQDWSLNKNNFALGYEKDELAVHVELKDLEEFTGAIYYRCADNIEAALQADPTKQMTVALTSATSTNTSGSHLIHTSRTALCIAQFKCNQLRFYYICAA